jgi:hypothetical protein
MTRLITQSVMQMPLSVEVLFISFHVLGLREKGKTSKPSGHYMYRQFNVQQSYVLPTQCIYVFCVDLITNSDYFPVQY